MPDLFHDISEGIQDGRIYFMLWFKCKEQENGDLILIKCIKSIFDAQIKLYIALVINTFSVINCAGSELSLFMEPENKKTIRKKVLLLKLDDPLHVHGLVMYCLMHPCAQIQTQSLFQMKLIFQSMSWCYFDTEGNLNITCDSVCRKDLCLGCSCCHDFICSHISIADVQIQILPRLLALWNENLSSFLLFRVSQSPMNVHLIIFFKERQACLALV